MNVNFEWNERKATSNVNKHKVRLEEAITVFSDPLAVIFEDEFHSTQDELREIIIGHSVNNRLLLVCFTERKDAIRIISAREATKKERKDYEENVHF